MRVAGIAGWVVAALIVAGTAQAQDPRVAVETANKEFMAVFAKHDASALSGFYTTTAATFPPGAEMIKGRDGIAKMWQGVFDAGIATAELKTTEVHAEGPLAYEVGTYAMKTKDGTVADHGKYVVVWLKEGGQWKLHRDIWNTNVPPAPAPKK